MYLVFGMVLGLHCVSADLCEFPNVSSVLPNIPACITPSGTIGDVADCHVTSLEGVYPADTTSSRACVGTPQATTTTSRAWLAAHGRPP